MVTNEGLVVGLATRNRPALVCETLAITLANIELPTTRVFVYIDDDDDASRDALRAAKFPPFKGTLTGVVRPRPDTIGEKWNWMLEENGECYCIAVDHSCHRTQGWDRIVLDAARRFENGPGAVFGPLANMSFPALNACTREWAHRIGYIYPPYFPYWFTDHWFDDVARMTELVELAPIVVDSTRKQPTLELREPAWWATWFDAARGLRERDALKVLGYPTRLIQGEAEQRLPTSHHPDPVAFRRRAALVTQDSIMINNNVRAMSDDLIRQSHNPLCDERYVRAKLKARGMIPDMLALLSPQEREHYTRLLNPPSEVPSIPPAFATCTMIEAHS